MSARQGSAAILLAAGLTGPASGQPPAAPARAPVPAPPVCTTPEHRQLDFWVGRWDVFPTGTDRLVARSLIERLYGGCVIREHWMPLDGAGGGSLNSWVPAEGRWRQIWTDGRNGWRDYAGGMEDGAIVLTATTAGPDGAARLNRMRFTREPGGAVRQVDTWSADGGRTWNAGFDYTYRPAREE
ncbi:hypothetical protein [Sphingosinicella sp. CPCC 101087]|uniref:hypothetical protein n=1 Tax=Sphingosinicella sp. CPCC 101087 TaxID=2497754 RepID=UPI00101CBC6C|nr:hypothetical protein [Sphingosinicella sp. CPCC 101087]